MTYGPKPKSFAERFWPKVDFSADCWTWQASVSTGGYGKFSISTSTWRNAHRIAYELLVGPIPVGLELDHLCKNRLCVNPDHLEPVSRRINNLRSASITANRARQTHCIRGHEFTPENTRVDRRNRRNCRRCAAGYACARRRRIAGLAA
jgi:hypothetical protein